MSITSKVIEPNSLAHGMVQVSVVIPALNEEKNLSCCLPRVREQLTSDSEIIVVDNGSTDATSEVAKAFGAIVLNDTVRSRARARNRGIQQSKGELVALLDADCIPDNGWLSRLIAPFDNKVVGAVAGEIINLDCGAAINRYLIEKGYLSQADNFKHSFLPFGATANLALRREVVEKIGYFDESLPDGEDADLCWRMQLETSYQLVLVASSTVRHMHSFSASELIRQKRRHSYAGVLLYKKYRSHWNQTPPPLKKVYWEYRSIAARGMRLCREVIFSKLRQARHHATPQEYQLLLEVGDKLGRLQGSIRHHVWYP